MPKYKIKELKKRPIEEPLPADVNEIPENAAKQFDSKDLLAALERMKKNRWFGEIVYIDPSTGFPAMVFEFNSGIIFQYKQTIKKDNVTIIRNVRNSKVE